MKRNWKDIFARAGKTFLQTFVSVLVLSITGVNNMVFEQTGTWWISVVTSAGAAGVAMVWNTVLKPIYVLPPSEGGVK